MPEIPDDRDWHEPPVEDDEEEPGQDFLDRADDKYDDWQDERGE